jgi:hypothetical protein
MFSFVEPPASRSPQLTPSLTAAAMGGWGLEHYVILRNDINGIRLANGVMLETITGRSV